MFEMPIKAIGQTKVSYLESMKNWDVDLGHQHSGDRDEAKHSEKLGALYFRACKGSLPVPKALLKSYLIFVIFSPRTQFLAKIFSTQKRVNRTNQFCNKTA